MLVGGLSVVYCHAGLYKARKPGTRNLLNRTAHKFGPTPGLKGIGEIQIWVQGGCPNTFMSQPETLTLAEAGARAMVECLCASVGCVHLGFPPYASWVTERIVSWVPLVVGLIEVSFKHSKQASLSRDMVLTSN